MARRKRPLTVYLPPEDELWRHLARYVDQSGEAARLMRAGLAGPGSGGQPAAWAGGPVTVTTAAAHTAVRPRVTVTPAGDKDPGWDVDD